MNESPDLGALELLLAVARHGSISAAAREVGVTQQSASARLRSLERTLGMELFQRAPSGAVPTPRGELVASWAQEVLDAARRLRLGVETLRQEHSRELVVAASQTVSAHLLPRWLVSLRERQLAGGRAPTTVRLLTANSAEVEHRVRIGEADLGFIEQDVRPAGLSRSVVCSDALAVVVAPGHPWGDEVAMAVVADTPLVVREEGSGTRRTWEDAVRRRLGREPAAPAAVLPATTAVRAAVAGSVAPAVLSRRAVSDDIRLGRLREVALPEPVSRPITALWRGGARDLGVTSRELIEIAVGAAAPARTAVIDD